MKYKLLTVLMVLLLIAGGIGNKAIAKNIPASFDWGKTQKSDIVQISKGDILIITVHGITTAAQTQAFLDSTKVILTEGGGKDNQPQKLYDMIKNKNGEDFAKNLAKKNTLEGLGINDFFDVSELSMVKIEPYLGKNKKGKPIANYTKAYTVTNGAGDDAGRKPSDAGGDNCVDCETDEDDPNLNPFTWKKITTNSGGCISCTGCDADTLFDPDMVYFDFINKDFYKYPTRADKINRTNKTLVNLSKDIKLNNKHHFKLAVENVNRYLYDVNIEANDVTYKSSIPPLLQKLFIGDTNSFLSSLINTYTKSIVTTGDKASLSAAKKDKDGQPCMNDLQCKQKQFTNAMKEFKKRYDYLKMQQLKAYLICNKFQCCGENDDVLDEDIHNLLQSLTWVRIKLMKLQNAIREDEDLAAQRKTYTGYIDQLLGCQNNDKEAKKSQKQLDDFVKTFDADTTDAQKKTLKELQEKVIAANSNKCDPSKTETLNKGIAQLETGMKYFAALDNIQAKLPSDDDIASAYLFVQNMRKGSNRFVTDPIYVSGNELELHISITPRDSSAVSKWDIMPYGHSASYYTLPAAFKPFVSFSSGSFLSLDKYTQNNTYTWQAVPNANNQVVADSNKYLLTPNGATSRPYGLNALMHVEGKFSRSFGIGLSAGVGLTLESAPHLAYLGGGSIMLGNSKQVAITYGIMGMNVERINTNMQSISDNKIIYRSSTTPAAAGTYKEFKTGQFISISYIVFTPGKRTIFSSIQRQKKRDADIAQAQADAKVAEASAVAAKARQAEAEANAKTKEAQK